MLSEIQLTEIRNYLVSRDLPLNLLMEVNDHFVEQILSLQRSHQLPFNKAFVEVKENWASELRFVPSNNLSGKKKTFIDREMDRRILKNISLSTFLCVSVATAILIFTAIFFSKTTFEVILTTSLLFIVFVPFILIYFYRKELLLKKKMNGLILNNCQDGVKIMFSFLPVVIFFFFSNITKTANNLYEAIFLQINKGGIATIIMIELLLFVFFFGLLMHFNFIRELKKNQHFLKYFITV